MNLWLILALLALVPLHGYVHAINSSNPECKDLQKLRKTLSGKIPSLIGKVDCIPNSNCTGVVCKGKVMGKSFSGISIVLEGCKEPVRMVVHANKKRMIITDNFHRKLTSKLDVTVGLQKKYPNTVLLTVTARLCTIVKCFHYKILNKQAIRVRCNDSALPSAQRSHDAPLPSKSPECKGLEKTKTQVENNFGLIKPLFRDAKISCKTANNCSDLKCFGVVNHNRFNATATVKYCSNPVKLRLVADVSNHASGKVRHIDHTFEDGQSYNVIKILPVGVDLKRVGNSVYLSVYVTVIFKKVYLVKNVSIAIDPSHCPGHHDLVPPIVAPSRHSSHSTGKSLSSGAIAGVVIAVIVFFVLLIGVIIWIVRGKRKKVARYNDLAMNDDTDPIYFDSDPIA
ncbi:uncharacterized protein LOC114520910 [Dendronephthya gigantea]|uniref:uncharacterized protein LOC114520910 n=1 Tax=Dendronephthya gigantea TaxID=151771 RepID=UPI00106C50BF|nr:uncharacterized protein LOC114520910 [Dendronephthya gigantea]